MRAAIPAFVLSLLTCSAAVAGTVPDPSRDGPIPGCEDPGVIAAVIERQNWAEAHTWRDGIRIAEITHISESYRSLRGLSLLKHRHCQGRAVLDNGRIDRVYYVVTEQAGFAGISWGIDFCLPRQDYYKVYNASCRVLK